MKRGIGFMLGIMALFWIANSYAQGMPTMVSTADGPDNKFERIHSVILMRLSTTLGLSSSQTQQMSTILARHHERKKQLRREVQDLTAQLKASMAEGNSTQTRALVAKLDATRRQLSTANDEMYAEARRMLNPQQQAQFMIVMDEVKREVRSVRDKPANPILAPGTNPYVPGSPYFPTPAFQGN